MKDIKIYKNRILNFDKIFVELRKIIKSLETFELHNKNTVYLQNYGANFDKRYKNIINRYEK